MGKRDKRRQRQPVGGYAHHPESLYQRMLQYLYWLEVHQTAARSIEIWEEAISEFLRWSDEHGLHRPAEITLPILERYQRYLYQYRKKDGLPLAVATQRGKLSALQGWFKWLCRNRLLLSNPASELLLPRVPRGLPRDVLSVEEVEQILNQPDITKPVGLRDRAMLEVLYSTGIRRMELAQLNVNSINLNRGTLNVWQGKGKKDRVVPIGQRAIIWVERYLEEVRPQFIRGEDPGILFMAHDGWPLAGRHLSHHIGRYVRESGVRKSGSCHLFRHTMATLMLENGADTRWIQAILGHASLETTQIYTQVSIRALKEIHTATHPAESDRDATDGAESPDGQQS